MKRRQLTKLQRVKVFDAAKGRCHLCDTKIAVGERWEVEHCKPLWLGGIDGPENMAPAHYLCHRAKTASERTIKAKGDRVRQKHLGLRKPRSIRGWRKFDGTPVHATRTR